MTTSSPVPSSQQEPEGRRIARHALAVAAVVEPLSLIVLLVNLVTLHLQAVASLFGPLHGTAYLIAIAAAWMGDCSLPARCWTWLPGFGALIAVRRANARAPERE